MPEKKYTTKFVDVAGKKTQVTIGGERYALPTPFFVLATQNPIEQEGTYPLPEAQRDRFLFLVTVDYRADTSIRPLFDFGIKGSCRWVHLTLAVLVHGPGTANLTFLFVYSRTEVRDVGPGQR